MKLLPVFVLATLCAACSSTGDATKQAKTTEQASENTTNKQVQRSLPTEEKAFVAAIKELDRKSIVAQLGEPAKADDVRIKGARKIVASIWHYHYINKDENGKYFQTTELDFIGDKVIQVVFLNNDGSEEVKKENPIDGIPENKPSN